MENFSIVMEVVSKRYGSYVYISPTNQDNDIFLCPRCKSYVVREDFNGFIEQINDGTEIKYICPICKKSF